MAQQAPEPGGGEPISDLRRRLERAQKVAGRLADEVGRVPPSGWQSASQEPADDDLAALRTLIELLRGVVPPELQRELAALLRELLAALRALIDWWIERLDSRGESPAQVEDIPID